MATFTDTFERKEVKYRLSSYQYAALLSAMEGRMAPDAYGTTRIMSLYLDTPERALIERSLDKPLYKEKLRLRSYGAPAETDRVYVEIKKKFDGIVYKRRVGMSYAAARAYLGGMPYEQACSRYPLLDEAMDAESHAARSVQIAREIDWFLAHYATLRASMIIACERTAYCPCAQPALGTHGAGQVLSGTLEMANDQRFRTGAQALDNAEDVRITFDAAITYRDMFASSASLSAPAPLLRSGEVIMEVKCADSFPLWLVNALSSCCAYPSSFSKYGEAYRLATEASGKVPFYARGAFGAAVGLAERRERSVAAQAAERIVAGVTPGGGSRSYPRPAPLHAAESLLSVTERGRCA